MTNGWAQGRMDAPLRGRAGNFKPLRESAEACSRIGDIMSVQEDLFHHALYLAFSSGWGVLLSPTSDGGALSVTLYQGDDRRRSYATGKLEFEALLRVIADEGEAHMMGSTPQTPKAPVRASQKLTAK